MNQSILSTLRNLSPKVFHTLASEVIFSWSEAAEIVHSLHGSQEEEEEVNEESYLHYYINQNYAGQKYLTWQLTRVLLLM